MLKKLDWYIIKKFLGTFFLCIVLILSIAIVLDLTEKMDMFVEEQVPVKEIIFSYYCNFVPYYFNMFSQLFIFMSVIFFTSKMAGNSEIIAILAAGVSYKRFLLPYMVSATVLFILCFALSGYIIPGATHKMLSFTDKYIEHFSSEHVRNVQMELEPGTVLYIESFQRRTNTGYRTFLEHFDSKTLTSRLTAERIKYDGERHWHFEQYTLRTFDGLKESLQTGVRLDTILPIEPSELFIFAENAQEMTNPELKSYIAKQQARGAGNIKPFITEWWKRWAGPVGAFIMTLLGVTMSSRKVRGGMGKNLGIGILLTAAYILFSTVSTTFSVSGVMTPFMAVWLPNIIFLIIAIFLYIQVRK